MAAFRCVPEGRGRARACLATLLVGLSLICTQAQARAEFAQARMLHLVIAKQGELGYWQLPEAGSPSQHPLPQNSQVPIGSLWKLWVYAYLADGGADAQAAKTGATPAIGEPPYTCQGNNPEEAYCCSAKGEQVGRDMALAKSCGLYFSPNRLNLDATHWRTYWQDRGLPAVLLDLTKLTPAQQVPLAELLSSLAQLPAQSQAKRALLQVLLSPQGKPHAAQLGGRLRVKTWSWRDAAANPIGGFAGWLADGTPLWAQAAGTSAQVLSQYGTALNTLLANPPANKDTSCVQVRLFAAYPIKTVLNATGQPAKPGPMVGQFRVEFDRGTALAFNSNGETRLGLAASGKPELTAEVTQAEYIARVLEREASAEPLEAAKALAITVRTYLLQNARRTADLRGLSAAATDHGQGECWLIDDSSQTQRVSPSPAGAKARAIAYWTEGLISTGTPVRYHLDQPGLNRLVWKTAQQQAQQGLNYFEILNLAFPQNDLASQYGGVSLCQSLPQARSWLAGQLPKWRAALIKEPGFAPPPLPQLCQLPSGNPFNDVARNRIYARGHYSLQQRLDITHEYLHLAFADYPSGQDETYIEQLARRLLLGQELTHE